MANKDTHGHKGIKWVGFDLDGTLAEYGGWKGIDTIGEKINPLVAVAKRLHNKGRTIKIFTARVADPKQEAEAREYIEKWCEKNLGFVPEITHEKDALMEACYDDRSIQVFPNTGVPVVEAFEKAMEIISDLTDGFRNCKGYHLSAIEKLVDLEKSL